MESNARLYSTKYIKHSEVLQVTGISCVHYSFITLCAISKTIQLVI